MVPEKLTQHNRLYFTLVGAGTAFVTVAAFVAVALRHGLAPDELNTLLLVTIAAVTGTTFYYFRLLLSARSTLYMLGRAVLRSLRVLVIVFAAYVVIPGVEEVVPNDVLEVWAVVTLPLLLLVLFAMRVTAVKIYASGDRVRVGMFIMPGTESCMLAQRIQRSPVLGIRVGGYFDTEDEPEPGMPSTLQRLGDIDDAVACIQANAYDVVFVSMRLLQTTWAQRVLDALSDSTASIYFVPESRMLGYFHISSTELAGIPLLSLHETRILGLSRLLKRGMDVAVSLAMIVALSPLLLGIAIGVRLSSPGPVLFRQTRYGQSGEAITVFKFRTMVVHAPAEGGLQQATRHDKRVTRFGHLLRRTSLDELPQLLNVLLGDMSLVGPRPHAAEHNELYRRQIRGYMLRHTVKPGITGWAQVNGLRGETDTLEKMMRRVEYDRYYIQNWSISLDIRILLRTALLVVRDKKAY